jgi:hypothetical protein
MYSYIEESGSYYILNDGQKTTTPMGRLLEVKVEAIAREIANDLNTYGTDPSAAISMYSCTCSFTDFLEGQDCTPLVETAVNDAQEDAIHDISADPEILELQYPGFSQPILEENGVSCGLHQPENISITIDWLRETLESGSPYLVMCVILAGANFGSPLLGVAIADNRSDLASMAKALCGPLQAHIFEEIGGIVMGGIGSYWPSYVNEDYCSSHCKGHSPTTLNASCGLYRSLDVMQRFAAQ